MPHKLNMRWNSFLAFPPGISQMLEQLDLLSMHPLQSYPSRTDPKLLSCLQPASCIECGDGILRASTIWRMLTYADVCWRMLTYADVCRRMRRWHSRPSPSRLRCVDGWARMSKKEILAICTCSQLLLGLATLQVHAAQEPQAVSPCDTHTHTHTHRCTHTHTHKHTNTDRDTHQHHSPSFFVSFSLSSYMNRGAG
jgi:hypothetical protein